MGLANHMHDNGPINQLELGPAHIAILIRLICSLDYKIVNSIN